MRRKVADNTKKTLEAKDKLNRYLENQLEAMERSLSRRLEQMRERLADSEDRIDYRKRESEQPQNDLN